jgi:hypothetical protein
MGIAVITSRSPTHLASPFDRASEVRGSHPELTVSEMAMGSLQWEP